MELHYAHAYTMASFLSALNRRDDGYGGSRENRVRLPLEVYRAVRARGERAVRGRLPVPGRGVHPGRQQRRGRGLVRRASSRGPGWTTSRSPRAASSRTPSSRGSAGPRYPYTGPQRLRVHADRALGRARAVRAEPGSDRAPCGRRCAPRGAGRRWWCRAASRPSSRRRSCSGAARPTSSPPPARAWPTPTGSGSSGSGLRRRGAALRLHQLLRGPRPGAQAGDLQALGPLGSRRGDAPLTADGRRRLVAPAWEPAAR